MARRSRGARAKGDGSTALAVTGHVDRPSNTGQGILNHKFRAQKSVFSIVGNSTTLLQGVYITFKDVPNYASYVALFDQYRIDVVEVTVNLRGNSILTGDFPVLTFFPDFDDSGNPPTLSAAQSHPRAKIVPLTPARPSVTFAFEPRVALATYQGVVSAYSAPSGPVFCDSASTDVQHFGWKYAVENMQTGQFLDVRYRIWFTCRNPL